MITLDDLNVSNLVDASMNTYSPTQQVCRVQHSTDVQKNIIHSDLDYAVFDKVNSAGVCLVVSKTKPCTATVIINGQKFLYIRYSSGTYTLSQTYYLPNGYTGMIVEGVSQSATKLNTKNYKFSGVAFYLYSNDTDNSPKYLYMRNLSIIGGYAGFSNIAKKTPNTRTSSARAKWQKAIWAFGPNSHAFVSNVNISGFYYGLTVEQFGDAVAENVFVTKSGDGGFFAYFGGRLYACDSESSYAADYSRRIGFGFVAESLQYLRKDALGIAQCKGGNPNNPDRWTDYNFNQCIINASLNFPENMRSYIFARHISSHDNLFGGIMANMGAKIDVSQSVIFNQYSPTAAKLEPLNIRDLNKPNVYNLGNFGAGHGILARSGSTVLAHNNKVFNNLIGFNAYWNGTIDATGSGAWNNMYYAFHSVSNSFINATRTISFGFAQLYSYAVDNSSAINVDISLALAANNFAQYSGPNAFCEQFENPCVHVQHFTAEKNVSTRNIIKLDDNSQQLGIFYNDIVAMPQMSLLHSNPLYIKQCSIGLCLKYKLYLADETGYMPDWSHQFKVMGCQG